MRQWRDSLLHCKRRRTVVHEEGVVGTGADDADLDAVLGVPAGKAIKDVDVVARVQVVDRTLAIDFERVLCHTVSALEEGCSSWSAGTHLVHLNVDGAPPNVILGSLLVHDALVLGRAPGLLARVVDQRARVGNDGALVLDRVLVELADGRVPLETASVCVSELRSGPFVVRPRVAPPPKDVGERGRRLT